jgi:iron complex outermembrane recepter protein
MAGIPSIGSRISEHLNYKRAITRPENLWGKSMKNILLVGVLAAVSLSIPMVVRSQDASSDALETITVTAEKRSEDIRDVPISITALSAASLKDTAANNFVELQGVVPGLLIQSDRSYGGAPFAIRGVSGQSYPFQEDPVAAYVDGVYYTSTRFGTNDLSDIAAVEVVRGPQGTLQGRNATAGAVLVRTADPEDQVGGYVRVTGAYPTEGRVEAVVTGPLTDTLDARLSVNYLNEPGWGRNEYDDSRLGGQKVSSVRGILLWKPNERFHARLALSYQSIENIQALARWASTPINPPPGQAVTNPTPGVPLSAAQQNQILNNYDFDVNIDPYSHSYIPALALEMEYDFDYFNLFSVTGASTYDDLGRNDSDGLGYTDRQGYNVGKMNGNSVSEEVRLQSKNDSRLLWTVGGYASHSVDNFAFDIYNLALTVPINEILAFRARVVNPSYAAFGDTTFKFTDKLSVTGGVRYTTESKTFNNGFAVDSYPVVAAVVGPIPFAPPKKTWDDVSWRANIDYKITNDTLLYASYSKGFKSGGFNAFSVGPSPAYNPEDLYSTEVGVKTSFLENQAYVAASAYDNLYKNLQVAVGVPQGGVIINNAASARIKGFEVEGEYKPIRDLTLNANVAYIDAVYTTFQNTQDINGNFVNASGNSLTYAPRWQYYVAPAYTFTVNDSWTGRAQIDWRWRDKIFLIATNQGLPNLTGDADGELGGRVSFYNKAHDLTVAIFGTNLTDKRVVNGEALAFSYPVASFNKPRTVGVQLEKKF